MKCKKNYRGYYKVWETGTVLAHVFFTGLKPRASVTARQQSKDSSKHEVARNTQVIGRNGFRGPETWRRMLFEGMRMEWWTMNNYVKTLPGAAPIAHAYTFEQLSHRQRWQRIPQSSGARLDYDAKNPKTYEIVFVNYEPQNHPMHAHGIDVYRRLRILDDQQHK